MNSIEGLEFLTETNPVGIDDLEGLGLVPCPAVTCIRWWSKWF
jgi:hypothetical protein